MDIFEHTTVYIACPANGVSGGPELLHQLCSELLRRNIRARMCYVDVHAGTNPQPAEYAKYHVPYTISMIDRPENVIIIPEAMPHLYGVAKYAQKVFWWMSVDNYVDSFCQIVGNSKGILLRFPLKDSIYCFYQDARMEHWLQSVYAHQFIRKNHVPEEQIHFVGDYLQSESHLDHEDVAEADGRQDIVAFNPRKGFAFTKQIIEAAPSLRFAPIQNMTPAQVHDLLRRSKVYIDFGNHPGQDRIPREAAAAGCCIITGRRGAAANPVDIPIPASYKFEDAAKNIPGILACIQACIEDYEMRTHDFDRYRTMIAAQRRKFRTDVGKTLSIHTSQESKQKAILAAGPHFSTALPSMVAEPALHLVGIWMEKPGTPAIRMKNRIFPVIPLTDLLFLWKEGRYDCILLEPGQDMQAQQLLETGIPADVIRWLRQETK